MPNQVKATITLTTQEDVSVPIDITIEWPDNLGYYTLSAINKIEEIKDILVDGVIQQLISNGDTSLLAHLPDED